MDNEADSEHLEGLSDKELSLRESKVWKGWFDGFMEEMAFALATVTFVEKYKNLPEEYGKYLKEKLKSRPLLDLGAGQSWRPDETAKLFIKRFDISGYIGVDLECVEGNIIIDGILVERKAEEVLKVLSEYSGKSNVMSNGFLCSEMVGRDNEYVKRVLKHIVRILPENGVFVTSHFNLDEDAVRAGFVLERDLKGKSYDNLKIWRTRK